jgi:hypothetical protein
MDGVEDDIVPGGQVIEGRGVAEHGDGGGGGDGVSVNVSVPGQALTEAGTRNKSRLECTSMRRGAGGGDGRPGSTALNSQPSSEHAF